MDLWVDHVLELLSTTAPAQYCQLFFILTSAAVISLQLLPPEAHTMLMSYGARGNLTGTAGKKTSEVNRLVKEWTTRGQVPHAWFVHFYILSVTSSLFWAWQYAQGDSLVRTIALWQAKEGTSSMTLGQVYLACSLMTVQGFRRLWECLFISKASSTSMLLPHWLVGLAFYTVMGISVWIEGSGSLLKATTQGDGALQIPIASLLGAAVFLLSSLWQNRCHRHLASLVKYTVPTYGPFKYVVCPHYTCECLIYLSLAVVASPLSQHFNRTILCGLFFVIVNLGVTACDTRDWYIKKFGDANVRGKWKMLPPIF